MNFLKKTFSHIKNDAFLKNNVVFFVGSLFIAFLNYLYYPVMSRIMSVEQFGEMQTIFSLIFLSGVVLTVFRMIVLHITANSAPQSALFGDAATSEADAAIPALYTSALFLHLPFFIILAIGSPFISRYFSFETHWAFFIFAVYLLLSVYQTFYTAHLHGKSSFHKLNVSNVIQSAAKLVLSFALVYIGFGVLGATFALVLASIISLYYMRLHSPQLKLSLAPSHHIRDVLKKEIPYGLLVLISLGFITILYSADVLIVKRLFSPDVAGLYSGVATIARIIFFATGSISGVLLASITVNDVEGKNRITMMKGITLVLAIGGAALLIFSFFPAFIIHLLVGVKYTSYAHFLPSLSLYLFLASLLNLFVSYLLAIRSYMLFPISLIGLLILSSTLFIHHTSVQSVIFSFTISTAVALILSVIPVFSNNKKLLWTH